MEPAANIENQRISWRNASAASGQSLESTAKQLEGIFIGMVFQEMAKGIGGDAQSPGAQLYNEWFRTAVADEFAAQGGVGFGDSIVKQLEPTLDRQVPQKAMAASISASRLSQLPISRVDSHSLSTLDMIQHRNVSQRPLPQLASEDVMGKKVASDISDGGRRVRRFPPIAGEVTSRFGMRVHPLDGEVKLHKGIDIAARVGTPVQTPYNGSVLDVGTTDRLGKYIRVRHMDGFVTLYAHLSEVKVKATENVYSGSTIGLSGKSGAVTGPHLHFGIFRNGKPIDPESYIDFGLGAR